jgi:hypothetical protein
LVANAGVSKAATIEETTVEDFDMLFAVNVRVPFFLVQQLLPIMSKGSSIVFLSSLAARAVVGTGSQTAISGIAWGGGYGIRSVEILADNGETWANARLGEDLGKFAFRPWSYDFAPKVRGKLSLTARATNKVGQTQTKELIQNPAGYHHNLMQILTLDVA